MNNIKTRNSNLELLRLVLMVMIIVHHFIVHGLALSSIGCANVKLPLALTPGQMPAAEILNAFCISGVNCFILISGYFGISLSKRKLAYLLLSLIFYMVLLWTVPHLAERDWKGAFNSLFFLSRGYWFVTDYIFLMLLSPMINIAFEKLSVRTNNVILATLLIISCYFGFLRDHEANINGYSLIQFITMYLLGRKIAATKFSPGPLKSLSVYVASSLLCGLLMWIAYRIDMPRLSWRFSYYNNPLVIISAVSLMLFFKSLRLQSPLINRLSRSSLGIYLFQSSFLVGALTYPRINMLGMEMADWRIFPVIIGLAIATAAIAILFDQLRILVTDPIMKKIK